MVPDVDILNTYIRYERRDYLQRMAAAARGQIVPHTLPCIEK